MADGSSIRVKHQLGSQKAGKEICYSIFELHGYDMESSKRRLILIYTVTTFHFNFKKVLFFELNTQGRNVGLHGKETSKSRQRNANRFIKALNHGKVLKSQLIIYLRRPLCIRISPLPNESDH